MQGLELTVGQSFGRRVLSADDRWTDARNLLQESLDLEDTAKINQLASALAIQVDDRVAKKADDSETASEKKEHLLGTLSLASKRAIKREGYVCAALSTANAICSNSSHISAGSVSHIAALSKDLLESTDSSTLAEICAGSVLRVFAKALGATYENRTCSPEGRGTAQGDHLSQFLTNVDTSLKDILIKSSSQLLTGQQLSSEELQDLSSISSGFAYSVSRVSRLGGGIEKQLDRFIYRLPSEVQHDPRLTGNSVKILFGAFERPPNMNGTTPISPAVSLTLATEEGTALIVSNTVQPINITIPVSTRELCNGAERKLFTGKVRCLFWDKQKNAYSSDGCATIQDHAAMPTQVTCMCTHLTTFVVWPEINEPNCDQCEAGSFQEQACTSSSHRVCLSCPQNSWSTAGSKLLTDCKCNVGYTGSDGARCAACPVGKKKNSVGASTCADCGAGKYSEVNASTVCTDCGAGKLSAAVGATVASSCAECEAGKYSGASAATVCTECGAGKLSAAVGASAASTCAECGAGKYSEVSAATVCSDCVAGKLSAAVGASAASACAECGAGKYSGASAATVCSDCVAGKFKADAGVNTACDNCAAGKYKASSGVNLECDNCARDTYSVTEGADTAQTCTLCVSGRFSAPGSDSQDDCGEECMAGQFGQPGSCELCPAGSYRTVEHMDSELSQRLPASCPGSCPLHSNSPAGSDQVTDCMCNAGYFGNNGGTCSPCPAGKYSGASAATVCTNCGAGQYKASSGAKTTCDDCAAGKHKATAGVNIKCDVCEAGKYSGASAATVCIDCVAGKLSAAVGATAASACTDCGAGKYSGASAATVCSDCVAGKLSAAVGATAASACTDCGAGKYSGASAATVCSDCGAGKLSAAVGASAASSCAECGAGKYSGASAATVCTECVAGKLSAAVGATAASTCAECGAGKYSGASAATVCTECVAGKLSAAVGATVCFYCGAGKYSGASAATVCTDCGAGKYSTIFGSASCEPCRAGSYKETLGNGTCMPCKATPGQYCPTASASPSGDACPTDHYCEGGQADKAKCPVNSASIARSALKTACACKVGYTGPNGGECTACPAGKSKTVPGSEPCKGPAGAPSAPATDAPAAGAPAADVIHVVIMAVKLPMTKEQFNTGEQAKFKQSIASAASVSADEVTIDKIENMRRFGRRLLAGSIRVDTSVVAADQTVAESMANTLTVEKINAELGKNGLPQAEILDAPKVKQIVKDELEKSNKTPIIIAAVVSVVLILIAVGACVFVWRRRTTIKKADTHVWTDLAGAQSSPSPQGARASAPPVPTAATSTNDSEPAVVLPTPGLPQIAREMREQQQIVGDYASHAPIPPTKIDTVLLNVATPRVPTSNTKTPVALSEINPINFSKPPEEFKSEIAKKIKEVLSKSNISVTAEAGFIHNRPMEGTAKLIVAPKSDPAHTSQAIPEAGVDPSYTSPLFKENDSAYVDLQSPSAGQTLAPVACLAQASLGSVPKHASRARLTAMFPPPDDSESSHDEEV
jgi:hypothetical protein